MSDSGNSAGAIAVALFAAGPATGVFIYASIQAKYRNRKARYMPEKVVDYKVERMDVNDNYAGTFTTKRGSVQGRNESDHAQRAPSVRMTKD